MLRAAPILLLAVTISTLGAFTGGQIEEPAQSGASTPGESGETPTPPALTGEDFEGGGLAEPKPERVNEPLKPAKDAVGYLAEFTVYRRTFRSEVAVGPPVSHEMKVYSHFFPWSRDHGLEIARIFDQPKPIKVKDMQCQIRIDEHSFGVATSWVDKREAAHQLYSKTHSLRLHPSKATDANVLEALSGGLIYLYHPTRPTEMQVFVKLTPVTR